MNHSNSSHKAKAATTPSTPSHTPKRSQWSSRFAFIMASTGAAVGLGNVWKFPYMAGENGGGAFVLLYLLAVALVGLPSMMSEIVIGRLGKQNPVNTMETLAKAEGQSPKWQWLGWWGALGLIFALSFYSVVAGWSLGYLKKAWTGGLSKLSPSEIQVVWQTFLASPKQLIICHTLFMFLTLWVIANGVQAGIERACKIMMPGLFLILILLVFYGAIEGDFVSAFKFLILPNLSEITPSSVIYALGHAFFTLAVGAGTMLVYGSYIPPGTRVASNVIIVALLDVLVALLSGFAIFSLVFAHKLAPEGGPGLMFQALPIAFSKMPFGLFFGGLFFLLLWFAAWASSISMAEPLVVLLIERHKISRTKASIIVGSICWVFGLAALLSFNVWSDIKIFGRFTFFEAMADVTTNIILPAGGLCFAIFAGWILSAKMTQSGLLLDNTRAFKLWRFLARFVAPAGIIIIFIWNFF